MKKSKGYRFKVWACIEREDLETGDHEDIEDADAVVKLGEFNTEEEAREAINGIEFMFGFAESVKE